MIFFGPGVEAREFLATSLPLIPRNTCKSADLPVETYSVRNNRTWHTAARGAEATNTLLPWRN